MDLAKIAKSKVALPGLFFIVSGLMTVSVWAAEPGKDAVLLFNTGDNAVEEQIARFDFDPATPGIELLIGNDGESTILPGSPGPVRGEAKVKFSMYSADGTSLLVESPTLRVWSSSYPDPGDPVNQQGGANVTFYGSVEEGGFLSIPFGTAAVDAREMVLDIIGFPIGFGIAATNSATTRTLVFGVGIDFAYSNLASGDVISTRYKLTSLDATTLTQLCAVVIPAIDQWGWGFEGAASLGNYLAGGRALDDEIKITKYREDVLFDEQQTLYLDPRTCVEISRINLLARRP